MSFKWSSTPKTKVFGLGSFPFARRYLGNRCFFLFLRVLRCFSSPRCLLHTYRFSMRYLRITVSGFPHSDICGSTDICSLPQLFAACPSSAPSAKASALCSSSLDHSSSPWFSVIRSFLSLIHSVNQLFLVSLGCSLFSRLPKSFYPNSSSLGKTS